MSGKNVGFKKIQEKLGKKKLSYLISSVQIYQTPFI